MRMLKLRMQLWIGVIFCVVGCSSDVSVGIQGCENCPDRCLQEANRGRCVTCLTDTQCQTSTSPTKKCTSDNRCVCGSDKDCPESQLCAGASGCVECKSNADCKTPDRSICVANRCLRCEPKAIRACGPEGIEACVKGTQSCTNGESWSECQGWKTCQAGEICQQGRCVYACPVPAPCQPNQKSCVSQATEIPGRYRACTQDTNQCWVWGQEQSCKMSEICDKGTCQPYTCPPAECKDQEQRCDGTTSVQACGKNSLGCLVWLAKQPCSAQQFCSKTFGICVLCEPRQTRTCYTGDPKTQGVGICQGGQQECFSDGTGFSACFREVLPSQEVCDDNKDNNCDGVIDENCTCLYDQKKTGVCTDGKRDDKGQCQPPKSYSLTEICGDALDNNCNGVIDEGCPCAYLNLNKGVCVNSQQDAQGQCEKPAAYSQTEICNDNLDNNCDGNIDEGCAPALVIQSSINTSNGQIDGNASSAWDSASGIFKAGAVQIPAGMTVKVTGTRPLIIESSGDITIHGVLQASGEIGKEGNATNSNPSGATGGSGGLGCCGGSNGGKGGNSPSGSGTAGSGSGAGKQGNAQNSGQYVNGGGGGGAGHATSGYQGFNGVPGGSGGTYGDTQLSSLQGGSGGGGGSGGLGGASTGYGGSGGGGGGGVVKLVAGGTVTISSTGQIRADGGAGGRCQNVGAWSGGGAGSGGSIWLSAKTITNAGQVSAIGGTNCYMNGAPVTAGQGGQGRIRVDTQGAIAPTGSFSPNIGYVGSK